MMSISWSLAAITIIITTTTANTTITNSISALTTKRPLARSRHLLFRFRWPFYFFLSLTFIACQQRDRNELLCQFVTSNCCNNFPLDLQTLRLVKTGVHVRLLPVSQLSIVSNSSHTTDYLLLLLLLTSTTTKSIILEVHYNQNLLRSLAERMQSFVS